MNEFARKHSSPLRGYSSPKVCGRTGAGKHLLRRSRERDVSVPAASHFYFRTSENRLPGDTIQIRMKKAVVGILILLYSTAWAQEVHPVTGRRYAGVMGVGGADCLVR